MRRGRDSGPSTVTCSPTTNACWTWPAISGSRWNRGRRARTWYARLAGYNASRRTDAGQVVREALHFLEFQLLETRAVRLRQCGATPVDGIVHLPREIAGMLPGEPRDALRVI